MLQQPFPSQREKKATFFQIAPPKALIVGSSSSTCIAFLVLLANQSLQHRIPFPRTGIRSVVVAMILATDMAVHFELVENFKKLCATRGEEIGNLQPNENEIVVEPNEEMLLMKVMLHCADISNAAKPWKVSKEWSKRVWEEFTLQAEQEKRLGLPVTALVKDDPEQGVAEMSLNFIDYIVAPLFDVLQVVLPDLDGPFNFVESNRKSWKAKVQNIYKEEQERRKSPSGQMHRM